MTQRRRFTLGLALMFAVTAAAGETVRVSGNRIFLPVLVNGVATEALLDSGAETTLIDVDFAARLKLSVHGDAVIKGTGGHQPVRFASHVDLESSATRLPDRTVVILDLSDVSRRLVGERIDVVLGRELFDSGRFVLDIEAAQFGRVDPRRVATGIRLPLTDHAGIKQLPVQIDGVAALADFDLGNGSEMLIGRSFAAAQGWLHASRRVGSKPGGGLGGAVRRDLLRLHVVSIAGVDFPKVIAAVDGTEGAPQANVGVALLRNFVLTIDFPENAIWLKPVAREP